MKSTLFFIWSILYGMTVFGFGFGLGLQQNLEFKEHISRLKATIMRINVATAETIERTEAYKEYGTRKCRSIIPKYANQDTKDFCKKTYGVEIGGI